MPWKVGQLWTGDSGWSSGQQSQLYASGCWDASEWVAKQGGEPDNCQGNEFLLGLLAGGASFAVPGWELSSCFEVFGIEASLTFPL